MLYTTGRGILVQGKGGLYVSHLFLFSNIIAAMVGNATLVLLLLAFFHSKKRAPLYVFLFFLTATADYFLFIIATYFFQILEFNLARGFNEIQAIGAILTGIIIYGIPIAYRLVAQLTFGYRERLTIGVSATAVVVAFLSAMLAGADDATIQIFRLILLGTEFVVVIYTSVSSLIYLPTVRSLKRKRLILIFAPLHLLLLVVMTAYNFFSPIDILEFGYALFYLSWAVMLLIYSLSFLPLSNTADKMVDLFCKQYNASRREKEIIELVLDGYSNQKIADKLYISPRTVDTHLSNIYRKCGVEGRFGLIKHVKDQGG